MVARRLAVLVALVLAAPACESPSVPGRADATASATAAPDITFGDAPTTDATTATTPSDATTATTPSDATTATTPSDATTATIPSDATTATTPSDATAPSDTTTSPDVVSNGTVTVGAPDRILIVGTVVTPDVSFDGSVLVVGAHIVCAEAGAACSANTYANGATVIDTDGGVIAPGFIDTHNHILFDIFDDDDWLPEKLYTNHTQWPKEARYIAMLDMKQCLEDASQGKPAYCPAKYDGAGSLKCEMDKWGELKGVIAGTTSIVGLPGTSSGCFASLARSIDSPQNDLDEDHIQTSALFPPSKTSADGVCGNFADSSTDAYLIHVGEGTDAKALGEFAKLGTVSTTPGCLDAPETVITHGTAFTATEFAVMAQHDMKLAWSPASNVALYGATTNIPAALDAGILIALAPDWSMGGSQNILDEMRFAAAWDDAHFGDRLDARDLVEMTTKNAAEVLALDDRLGYLAAGYLADLVVVQGGGDPYAALVAARPASVMLTMVGGVVLYGDQAIQPAAPQAPGCEAMDVCGQPKFVCVAESSSDNKLNQTYAQIRAALETGLEDVDAASTSDGFDFAPIAPLVHCE
ncbi:MAG: amidohydrolase family protein [Myxococcota bacterium]